jgi:hypothetical protein
VALSVVLWRLMMMLVVYCMGWLGESCRQREARERYLQSVRHVEGGVWGWF